MYISFILCLVGVIILFNVFQHVPDYRLRPIVRVFLKPFVISCPVDFYDNVLLPVLAQFTPYSKFFLKIYPRKFRFTDLLLYDSYVLF